MNASDKVVMGIGILDVVSVLWTIIGALVGGFGISIVAANLSRWGAPIPLLLGSLEILAYVLIAACGVLLVLRQPKFAWLNYVLAPLRLVFVLPTLFPIFMIGSTLGLGMHPVVGIVMLAITEVVCCLFIFFWQRPRRTRSVTGRSASVA